MRIEQFLDELSSSVLSEIVGAQESAKLRPTTDSRHGDYQLNAAMALAKKYGKKPREIAEPLADRLEKLGPFAKAEVAGPGFVNLTLDGQWISRELHADMIDLERDGIPKLKAPSRIVVDFSSPNIAKQMHVGHLRSTIIGDAIVRILREVGHSVVGVNHIGDWGTQYGLLLAGMRAFGNPKALENSPIEELERIYKAASEKAKSDEAFQEEARKELSRLQKLDPENLALWKTFVQTTRRELDNIYERLGITFDSWRGESAYHDDLEGVVSRLEAAGIAREDQGAKGIFWQELEAAPPELKKHPEPFLVQKKDGAFLYSTTDIAAALYRKREERADCVLYVVDARQEHHFTQLFAVMRLLGEAMQQEHVSFGTVLGTDGKPLKTRDGKTITLASLLDEAEARARARLEEGVSEGRLLVSGDALGKVARAVGIGAVKYADLRQNRSSDYQFDWDKMVSFQGNAGPYLQYAYARVQSVLDRGQRSLASAVGKIIPDEVEADRLARVLIRFGEVVHQAAESRLPHLITDHLYDLARAFMVFYEACPILKSEGEVLESRLALAGLTARQMKRGLGLLGIEVVERM